MSFRRALRLRCMNSTEAYVDLYLLPVPRANLAPYEDQASLFGRVAREHGALRVEAMTDAAQVADMSRMSYGGFAPFVTA